MAVRRRRVEVHVDEVVLDGVDVGDEAAFREAVRAHVTGELARLEPGAVTSAGRLESAIGRAVTRAARPGDGSVTTQ